MNHPNRISEPESDLRLVGGLQENERTDELTETDPHLPQTSSCFVTRTRAYGFVSVEAKR